MIRLTFTLTLLVTPLLLTGPLMAQTEPADAPLPDVQPGTVIQAPSAGPLLPLESAPSVGLIAPEGTAAIIAPEPSEQFRPVPRPLTVERAAAATVPTLQPVRRPDWVEAAFVAATDAAREEGEGDVAAFDAVQLADSPDVAEVPESVETPAEVDVPTAPAVERDVTPPFVSLVAVEFSAFDTVSEVGVTLPDVAPVTLSGVPPVAAVRPVLEPAPIVPRPIPPSPEVGAVEGALEAPQLQPLSALVIPSLGAQPAVLARVERLPEPSFARPTISTVARRVFGPGPESLTEVRAPAVPMVLATEAGAAVQLGSPLGLPLRVALIAPLQAPMRDGPIAIDNPVRVLPTPDTSAVARMISSAEICWELAELPAEARWAEVSVDVALDQTNMPSEGSIRLTGFAGVVSGAAEIAYRAAVDSLTGCAEATDNRPATMDVTLVFDRRGVRLQ